MPKSYRNFSYQSLATVTRVKIVEIEYESEEIEHLSGVRSETSAAMGPGGRTSSIFYTYRTRTLTKFIKMRAKMHSVVCQLVEKKVYFAFFRFQLYT